MVDTEFSTFDGAPPPVVNFNYLLQSIIFKSTTFNGKPLKMTNYTHLGENFYFIHD